MPLCFGAINAIYPSCPEVLYIAVVFSFVPLFVSVAFDGITQQFCTYMHNIARAVRLCTEMIHTCSVELLKCDCSCVQCLHITNALNIIL